MDPQKRGSRLPFLESIASKEPSCCSLVLNTARNDMIGGRIRRREPSSEVILQLIPYHDVRIYAARGGDAKSNERVASSISIAVFFTILLVSFPPSRTNIQENVDARISLVPVPSKTAATVTSMPCVTFMT